MVSNSLVGRLTHKFGYLLHISEQRKSIVFGLPSNSVNKSINSPYVGLSQPVTLSNEIATTVMSNINHIPRVTEVADMIVIITVRLWTEMILVNNTTFFLVEWHIYIQIYGNSHTIIGLKNGLDSKTRERVFSQVVRSNSFSSNLCHTCIH